MFDTERLFDVYGEETCGKRQYKRQPVYKDLTPSVSSKFTATLKIEYQTVLNKDRRKDRHMRTE